MTAVLALAGALIIGGADFAAGLISRRHSALRVTVWVQVGSLAAVLAAVWPVGSERITRTDVVAGIVAGLSGGFSFATFYAALARGQMGRVAPVTAVVGAIIPSVVGVIRGEPLGPLVVIGALAALAAIVFVTQERGFRGGSTPTSAFVLAATAGFGFAIFFLALSETSPAAGLWPLVFARLTSVPAVLGLALLVSGGIGVGRVAAWQAATTGSVEMIANVLALLAFQRGPLVIATVLSSFYPLSTVLAARWILGERMQWIQAMGVGLAIISVPLITLG